MKIKMEDGGVQKRLIGLDWFRIALAFVVFMFHSRMHMGCDYGILNSFVEVGAIAMTGFFILSGFVLQHVYGNCDLTDWAAALGFWWKRIIGLYPAALFVGVCCAVFFGNASPFKYLCLLPIELLCVSSWFESLFGVVPNGGIWFVSCLVVCYFIYPFVGKLVVGMPWRLRVCFGTIFYLLLTYSPFVVHEFDLAGIYANPFFRFLEFALGVILASCKRENRFSSSKRPGLVSVVILVFLIVCITWVRMYYTTPNYMVFSVIVVPSFCALVWTLDAVNSFCVDGRSGAILRYCSDLMLPFFLVQLFCFKLAYSMSLNGNFHKIIGSFLLCLISAVVVQECIQRPAKKILRKIW